MLATTHLVRSRLRRLVGDGIVGLYWTVLDGIGLWAVGCSVLSVLYEGYTALAALSSMILHHNHSLTHCKVLASMIIGPEWYLSGMAWYGMAPLGLQVRGSRVRMASTYWQAQCSAAQRREQDAA